MSADEVAAAIVRQEAIAKRADDMADAYAQLGILAELLGLDDEAERARGIAQRYRADAADVRSW